jgi:hypothetical protein
MRTVCTQSYTECLLAVCSLFYWSMHVCLCLQLLPLHACVPLPAVAPSILGPCICAPACSCSFFYWPMHMGPCLQLLLLLLVHAYVPLPAVSPSFMGPSCMCRLAVTAAGTHMNGLACCSGSLSYWSMYVCACLPSTVDSSMCAPACSCSLFYCWSM